MEACTVAKILVEEVLCRFGIPQTTHSDQGRQFESNLFQDMCKLLGIEKHTRRPITRKATAWLNVSTEHLRQC